MFGLFSGSAVKNVSTNELAQVLENKPANVKVIDVRTPAEYAGYHIDGALNIDIYSPKFDSELEKLDKSGTYYVICAAGGRSKTACSRMSQLGFTNVINVSGGMSSW